MSVGHLCAGWHWATLAHRGALSGLGEVASRHNSRPERIHRSQRREGERWEDTGVWHRGAPQLPTCKPTAALISQVQKAVRITALLPANRGRTLTAAPGGRGSTRGQNLRTGFCRGAGSLVGALLSHALESYLSGCGKESLWERVSHVLPFSKERRFRFFDS